MQKVVILVKPGSKVNAVEEVGDGLVVRVSARAVDGKANEAVVKLLAKYFKVAKSKVAILHGQTGRRKVIAIDDVKD